MKVPTSGSPEANRWRNADGCGRGAGETMGALPYPRLGRACEKSTFVSHCEMPRADLVIDVAVLIRRGRRARFGAARVAMCPRFASGGSAFTQHAWVWRERMIHAVKRGADRHPADRTTQGHR